MIKQTTLMEVLEEIQKPEVLGMMQQMAGHFGPNTKFLPVERGTYYYRIPIFNGGFSSKLGFLLESGFMTDDILLKIEYREIKIIPFFGIMAGYDADLDVMAIWIS